MQKSNEHAESGRRSSKDQSAKFGPQAQLGLDDTPPAAFSNAVTTKSYLESLTSLLMDAWDGSAGPTSYDIIRRHCTPDFQMVNTNFHESPFPASSSLEEHLDVLTDLKRRNPAWKVHAYNVSAVVDEAHNHAVVWFTSGASGEPATGSDDWRTNRESVSQMHWRKRPKDGQWECYGHHCLRGGGSYGDVFPTG